MKRLYTLLAVAAMTATAFAQAGAPYIHDPSTLAECDGKFYTFGTGGGGLISEDGWTWHGGAVRPGGGAAPDVMKLGDRYLIIYGATGEDSVADTMAAFLRCGTRRLTRSHPTSTLPRQLRFVRLMVWRIRMPLTPVSSSILTRDGCG